MDWITRSRRANSVAEFPPVVQIQPAWRPRDANAQAWCATHDQIVIGWDTWVTSAVTGVNLSRTCDRGVLERELRQRQRRRTSRFPTGAPNSYTWPGANTKIPPGGTCYVKWPKKVNWRDPRRVAITPGQRSGPTHKGASPPF